MILSDAVNAMGIANEDRGLCAVTPEKRKQNNRSELASEDTRADTQSLEGRASRVLLPRTIVSPLGQCGRLIIRHGAGPWGRHRHQVCSTQNASLKGKLSR